MCTIVFARLLLYKPEVVTLIVKCQGTITLREEKFEFLDFNKSLAFKCLPLVRSEVNFTDLTSFKGVHFNLSPLEAAFVCLFAGFIFQN